MSIIGILTVLFSTPLQVFVIGKGDGELYHIWQRERDASWSDWEKLSGLPSSEFHSQPAMTFDDNGWWQAYGVRLVWRKIDECG